MSKLVKTGSEIYTDVLKSGKNELSKYLILPDGLDKLEEMLNEMISVTSPSFEAKIIHNNVSSVFARFKKENL